MGVAPPFAPAERDAFELLEQLVGLAPTNLEDPPHDRYEKPHYDRASARIAELARAAGLATRLFDPVAEGIDVPELRGIPRPNVVADLEVGATERVLILAHYDVVPVPTEQLDRWQSPPHVLTRRKDGRWYGRGSNDDLGSGVVTSLLALGALRRAGNARRNVRLLVCCDEETGGAGGVEAMKHHDDRLPLGDPGRLLSGDVALLPDGSPHACSGSSGLVFVDVTSTSALTPRQASEVGGRLVDLHAWARTWKSALPSPDWPDHLAPEPVITGRATLTRIEFLAGAGADPARLRLLAARSESDAANQIAAAVTLVFGGPEEERRTALHRVQALVPPPYRVQEGGATSLTVPPRSTVVQILGTSAHGGYPHRGHNPVPPTLLVLRAGEEAGWLDASPSLSAVCSLDLRLPPEMPLEAARGPAVSRLREAYRTAGLPVAVEAPEIRCRGGYAVASGEPTVGRLARLLGEEGGESGVFGEYGGTDASSLAEIRTPAGRPLPALVFGSMDRDAHIHEAEESVDPRLLLAVARTIHRFVQEP